MILEKNRKSAKTGKSGHYRAPTLQRREPTPRRRPTPRHGIPRRGEVEVPKWHPLGTPWCSIAAPRRSYCSQRAIFLILFSNTLYLYSDSIGTLINE